MKARSILLKSSAASLAMLMAMPIAAQAQQADSDTIIVTAQKREQRLQDVPIVVTSISARVLESAGVRDIKDMTVLTPGLTVTSTSSESSTTARIRGVGTVGDNPGLESSVGIVIDGVYRPRNSVGFGDLGEMDRIEVLKGPQGTLFGKNTSAGVINVMTKAPSFDRAGEFEATVGSFGEMGGSMSYTGPLVEDRLAGRIFVAARTRDGYTDVVTNNSRRSETDDQDRNYMTVRGQLLGTPSDSLRWRLIADYSGRDENCCVAVQVRTGPTAALINAVAGAAGVANPANPDARTAYSNDSTHSRINDGGVSLEVNKDFESGSRLTSISAYRSWEALNALDNDYTAADIWRRADDGRFAQEFSTFSQELRLSGSTDKVTWLIGGFYANENLDYLNHYTLGSAYEPYFSLLFSSGTNASMISALTGLPFGSSYAANSTTAFDTYSTETKSWAIFTNDSYKLTDRFEITLGLRYLNESKSMTANYTNPDGGAACLAAKTRMAGNVGLWALLTTAQKTTIVGNMCLPWVNNAFNGVKFAQSFDDDQVTGTLKAAYNFSDNMMGYVSYARGFKSGGYNLDRSQTGITPDPASTLYFPGETVDSYEVGLKNSFQGGKLQLNITGFSQTFSDFQLNTFLGTSFVVESIPEVVTQGVDADIYWRTPITGLSLQGGVTFANTEYSNFVATDLFAASHFPGLSLLPGNTVSFASEISASLAANWAGEMGGLKTTFSLSGKYTSEYNTGSDLSPYKVQDAFTLLNGRVGIGAPSGRWALEVWGQNLTDETYYQVVFNGPLQGSVMQSTVQPNGSYYNQSLDTATYDAFLGAPRTFGATMRLRF